VPWDDAIVVSTCKMRKLWDSLSELCSYLCERRLERTVLGPALLSVKTAQFTQFFQLGMTSHNKIAQFNWQCTRRFALGLNYAHNAACDKQTDQKWDEKSLADLCKHSATKYRVSMNYRRISLRHNLSTKCRKIVKFMSITHSERNIWNGRIVATAISREKRKPVLEKNGCLTDRA
jgi:hypothetical protein